MQLTPASHSFLRRCLLQLLPKLNSNDCERLSEKLITAANDIHTIVAMIRNVTERLTVNVNEEEI